MLNKICDFLIVLFYFQVTAMFFMQDECKQMRNLFKSAVNEISLGRNVYLTEATMSDRKMAKLITFELLERIVFISLKSTIINSEISKAIRPNPRKRRRFTKLKELALDIIEEFEAKELKLYIGHLVKAIKERRDLDKIERDELHVLCEETRDKIITLTRAFVRQALLIVDEIHLNSSTVANALESKINYRMAIFENKTDKEMLGPIDVDVRTFNDKKQKHKHEILEQYFVSELIVRKTSKIEKIFTLGRDKLIEISKLNHNIEQIAKHFNPKVLLQIGKHWADINGLYHGIPASLAPKKLAITTELAEISDETNASAVASRALLDASSAEIPQLHVLKTDFAESTTADTENWVH